nr:phospholipid scramblase family member 5 isoform X3 [Oryctolagus cuniculus]
MLHKLKKWAKRPNPLNKMHTTKEVEVSPAFFLELQIQTKASVPRHPIQGIKYGSKVFLHQLDLIIIHQQVELLGMILGTETSNKYEIKNSFGQRIYFAVEESICFNRTFCSTLRSCTLRITDNSGREVITVNRPLRCNSCWCPCYLQELEIEAPPGTIVGYVAQKWDPFLPKFTIQNANKEDILRIVGPCTTCGCFGDVDFEVKTINEKLTIGKISKYWSGFVNNVFTNADNFGIHVPADLDVRVKAAMIGACFLFDFMFFEHSLAGL